MGADKRWSVGYARIDQQQTFSQATSPYQIMLLEIFVSLILGLHLLCVDLAAAGPLVCLWLDWKEGRGDVQAGHAGRFLLKATLHGLVIGTLLGLAVGCFLWDAEYRAQLMRVASRVHFGVWEWLFSVGLLYGYRWSWRDATTCCPAKRRLRWLLPLLASTNLLYHFPPLFLIFSQLDPAGEALTSAQFRARLVDSYVVARTLHFCLAALAVTGIALVVFALKQTRDADASPDSVRPARWGARLALVATLLQLPVGIWIVLEMGPAAQRQLMGGSLVATGLFGLSLLGALALIHYLSAVAFGKFRRDVAVRTISLMILIVLLMTIVARLSKEREVAAVRANDRPAVCSLASF
jgi:hypothetical protein